MTISSTVSKSFKLALVQLKVVANKQANLEHAKSMVKQAANHGADMVVLPECFNSPYGTQYFADYAEELSTKSSDSYSESLRALSAMASENKIYLIGGSIPEKQQDKYFNTCTIWDRFGQLIGTHRKVHLFDIDVPGGIRFKESDVLSPGNQLTQIKTEFGSFGIGICYDIRFPEPAMIAARQGCVGMIYPSAFNMTTGPLHWELLQRARALDNQFFVAMCSPARDETASYVAWGHSTIVNPMGKVIASTEHEESIVYADINLDEIKAARQAIPVYTQRRFDLYPDVSSK